MKLNEKGTARDEIESGLGSLGRLRIMACLSRNPNEAYTLYSLSKATRLKRNDVKENLRRLVGIGWVKEYSTSMYPKYQANMENHNVKLIAEFFRETGYTG